MAYYKLNAYDADVFIPQFLGLNQYGADTNSNPCYAVDARNAFTREGVIMPMEKCKLLPASLMTPIKTLARFHRRWHTDDDEKRDILVAASDGQLYWSYADCSEWNLLPMPAGM